MKASAAWAAWAGLLLAAACGTAPGPVSVEGVWGGTGAELTVSASGATARFCCSTGTLSSPLVLDASGRFDVPGEYVSGAGPVPIGGFLPVPARFSGMVSGSGMVLLVTTPSYVLGPFALTYGQRGSFRCVCPL